jgi:hypothetical protein
MKHLVSGFRAIASSACANKWCQVTVEVTVIPCVHYGARQQQTAVQQAARLGWALFITLYITFAPLLLTMTLTFVSFLMLDGRQGCGFEPNSLTTLACHSTASALCQLPLL